jgi:hypothetical protein
MQLSTGLLSGRSGFNPRGICEARVAVGLIFLLVLLFPFVIIVPQVLHINPCRHHRCCIIQATESVGKCRLQLHSHIDTHCVNVLISSAYRTPYIRFLICYESKIKRSNFPPSILLTNNIQHNIWVKTNFLYLNNKAFLHWNTLNICNWLFINYCLFVMLFSDKLFFHCFPDTYVTVCH